MSTRERQQAAIDRASVLSITSISSTRQVNQQIATTTQQNEEVRQRVNDTTVRETVGRTRSWDEDAVTTVDYNKTKAAAQLISDSTVKQNELRSKQSTVITPQDKIVQLQQTRQVRANSSADLTRAIEKIQARCNHRYSSQNQRCIYCNKSRSSHVFDQPTPTIHNVRRK